MSARLERKPRPDLGPDVVEYEVDCEHGTTSGLAAGAPEVLEGTILAVLLTQHDLAEGPRGCRCTTPLWALARALRAKN